MASIRRSFVTAAAAVVVVLVAFAALGVVTPRHAEARPRTAADDAAITKLMGHADKLSAILETHVDAPKKALSQMDGYLKKHRKAMKKLVAQLVSLAGELDDDARRYTRTELLFGERTSRFVAALSAFIDKHGDDAAYKKKIDGHLGELEAEGKKLFEAYMK